MKKEIFLSIIIPMLNEEHRIEKTISEIKDYLSKKKFSYEVIFVDDGSTDNTISVAERLSSKLNHRIISYRPNRGKGYALKTGFKDARGDYILFMDADLSTSITEFEKFLPLINNETEIIIGSRKTKGAKLVKKQHMIRQKLGEGFTLLSNIFTGAKVSDYTCGFKLFRKDVGKKIFKMQRIERWGYDTEILFLARKYGYKIAEVPVYWTNDDRTKVNLVKDIIRSFIDLIRIRLNELSGKYD